MFSSDYEYTEFRVWATEGSCQWQRMQTSSGGVFDIPKHWTELRSVAKFLPQHLPDYLRNSL